ncbi:endoglucanase [Lactiplantibacillus garii]|uniref:Glucanase n=1 Tax=Lactiplantibacillus garii TaxID=2306423 RepID=A0A426D6T1_9LACO|nr:glycosyl hydrolase family 8 [Lactiplantibacillus garii]RRK10280.1 endoglucanase [Lactiplantibacillus garii]
MKKHWQWLLGGLIILITFTIGTVIFLTQRPTATTTVNKAMVARHYRVWQRMYLRGDRRAKFVVTSDHEEHTQTLSEAQGYGMLIAVLAAQQGLGKQKTFDQLTRYYLDHRLGADNPLMAWRQRENRDGRMVSTGSEKSSATDGDLDIAYALILADEQWGSGGKLNYGQLARTLIAAIAQREINPVTRLPRVGDWATDAQTNDLVRSSDLITAYYRKFARYTRDGSWTQVAQNSQAVLKGLSGQHQTGLMADFVTVRGGDLQLGTVKPKQVDSEYDDRYGFNACRVPWRVAYDYQLNHSKVSYDVVTKMLGFFKHCKRQGTVHSLAGKPLEKYNSAAFTTPIAYAAEVVGNKQLSQRYAPELNGSLLKQGYYPATIHMVTLLTSGTISHAKTQSTGWFR